METVAKGAIGAGVLMPLWDAIGKTGSVEAAYPEVLLSIDKYTKGKLKAGDTIDASNVDLAKDLLTPIDYMEIKQEGRVVDLIEAPTDINKLNPIAYMEATDKHRGKAMLDEKGNVRVKGTTEPWIGGIPFPQPKTAQEVICCHALSWGRHDALGYAIDDDEVGADGNTNYHYNLYWAEVQATSRIQVPPVPYMDPTKTRYNTALYTAPTDVAGTSYLTVWQYDQAQFPDFHGFIPAFKRIRRFPTNQRFEPMAPGSTAYLSDAWMVGDPYMTWGNFKIVKKQPMLQGPVGNWAYKDPNWLLSKVGGKSGKKYMRYKFSLVPEVFVFEEEPTGYPRSPYSKKWIYFDGRTMLPLCQIMFDRRGQMWKQWENVYDMYYREDGEKFYEVTGEPVWGWVALHCHDVQSGANGNWNALRQIEGGYKTVYNEPNLYEQYCTMSAIQQLGA
jgi:hypothetical protein